VDGPAFFGAEVRGGIHRLLNKFWPDGKAKGKAGVKGKGGHLRTRLCWL